MPRAWIPLVLLLAAPLGAQDQATQRQRLMSQIAERFMENYRQQAGLTPDQYQKFRAVAQRSFEQRRERQEKEQSLWRALEGQMRPGIAANPDSASKLLDGIVAVRAAAVDQLRADHRDYATFLTPVQRAQLFLQIERLQRNVEDMIRRRLEGRGMPGAMPGGGMAPRENRPPEP